jgi:hypothetical protein
VQHAVSAGLLFGRQATTGNQVVGGCLQLGSPFIGGLAHTADELVTTATRSLAQFSTPLSQQLTRLLTGVWRVK